ncbi:hypothetical protein [Paenisporosarcina sp. TG20]|uniref:hypothetical protein n=1 Tax=Paenisporosarcina sp. TG20 TaxID=1211706 RepID=UPI0003034421|nr:hypothetical protein [Paenisporosarcina sp. TG20]
MEIIIFAIIAFIINVISKRKKPVDEPSMSKPLDQRNETRDEGYAKETYEEKQIPDRQSRTQTAPNARESQSRTQTAPNARELQSRTQTAPNARELQSRTQTAPDAREPMSQVQAPTLKEQLEKIQKTRRSGRLSTHNPVETVVKESNPSFLVPTTEKNLIQAIIFSEIISSPKSKR